MSDLILEVLIEFIGDQLQSHKA